MTSWQENIITTLPFANGFHTQGASNEEFNILIANLIKLLRKCQVYMTNIETYISIIYKRIRAINAVADLENFGVVCSMHVLYKGRPPVLTLAKILKKERCFICRVCVRVSTCPPLSHIFMHDEYTPNASFENIGVPKRPFHGVMPSTKPLTCFFFWIWIYAAKTPFMWVITVWVVLAMISQQWLDKLPCTCTYRRQAINWCKAWKVYKALPMTLRFSTVRTRNKQTSYGIAQIH